MHISSIGKRLLGTNLILVGWLLFGVTTATAQKEPSEKTLRVGTRHVPPFAIRSTDGQWSGISIDLWREIADEMKWKYEFVDMDLKEMLSDLSKENDRDVDIVVGALTVTAEREASFDFTHAFHTSGLGMAVKPEKSGPVLELLGQVFTGPVLRVLGAIFAATFVLGILIYFLERRKNVEHFEEGVFNGILSGIWWAVVTMTTVGYGDKVPRSILGRLVALVWMLSGIVLIAIFTAVVTSSLTVNKLQHNLEGPEDLPSVRVATVANSTSADYLHRRRVVFEEYDEVREALDSLAGGTSDVVVYDLPILKYVTYKDYKGDLQPLDHLFERQDYAFGLPSGSPLREPCNRVLLRVISEDRWQSRLKRYLGE